VILVLREEMEIQEFKEILVREVKWDPWVKEVKMVV
jgi:hypothetical protein